MWLYPEFFHYHDPANIPYEEIAAKYPDVKPNQLRGMMRPAKKNETIFIALVDQLGFDPEVIPYWFARPERITIKRRKKASKLVTVAKSNSDDTQQHPVQPHQINLTQITKTLPQVNHKALTAETQQPELPFGGQPFRIRPSNIPGIGLVIDLNPTDHDLDDYISKIKLANIWAAYDTMKQNIERDKRNTKNMITFALVYQILNKPVVQPSVKIVGTEDDLQAAIEHFDQWVSSFDRPPVEETQSGPTLIDVITKNDETRLEQYQTTYESLKRVRKQNWHNALEISSAIWKQQKSRKKERLAKMAQDMRAPYAGFKPLSFNDFWN